MNHTRASILAGIVLLLAAGLGLTHTGAYGKTLLPDSRSLLVAYAQSDPSAATPIPSPTPPAPQDGTLASITLIHYTDHSAYYTITYWSDGYRVAGFLGRPTTPGPHPAMIVNRGGYGQTGALTGAEIVPYVEAGYVTVASQYRGNGAMYGQNQGVEDFGGNDVHDVTNLITLLSVRTDVDPARIGMVGGSRGGMMTYIALKNEALTGQNRIAAAATVGGISDVFLWDRNYGGLYNFDGVLWRPLVRATPEENPSAFEARSAIYWPELVTAPLLLLHGEADNSVSIQQTYAFADALTQAGHPPRVITFPGGDHSLSNYNGGLVELLDWFDLYLGADADGAAVDRSYATHAAAINAVQTWFVVNAP